MAFWKTSDPAVGLVLDGKYRIVRRIGGGSFGQIYIAEDVNKNDPYDGGNFQYVVKQEKLGTKKPHLKHEYEAMKYLSKNCVSIPKVYYFQQKPEVNYMVMDLKGPNLSDLFSICGKHFGTRTISHIGTQIMHIFKFIHGRGMLHRDLKPENITVGRWPHDPRTLYLIDFGLSKQFVTIGTDNRRKHIPMKNPTRVPKRGLTGTVRYASVNAHYGDQSRRDDLASFGHVLIYFLRGGNLPWMGMKALTKADKYKKILKLKESVAVQSLLKDFPQEYHLYMTYVSQLKFTEKPNYRYLVSLFEGLMKRKRYTDKHPLQWERKCFLNQQWPPDAPAK